MRTVFPVAKFMDLGGKLGSNLWTLVDSINFEAMPVLTTQGNPPVATAVIVTHFVVARGEPPVTTGGGKLFPTGGHHKMDFSGKTTRIRSRNIKKQLELDLKLPKNHWNKILTHWITTGIRSKCLEKTLK